ncbi:hypothetical protein HZ326_1199 [Fusarium oxysporum f. sp. albedinis]|nr:hypothetical protein HZ326_1199 [Fusarium oxysporum f. sp. albedinis]
MMSYNNEELADLLPMQRFLKKERLELQIPIKVRSHDCIRPCEGLVVPIISPRVLDLLLFRSTRREESSNRLSIPNHGYFTVCPDLKVYLADMKKMESRRSIDQA